MGTRSLTPTLILNPNPAPRLKEKENGGLRKDPSRLPSRGSKILLANLKPGISGVAPVQPNAGEVEGTAPDSIPSTIPSNSVEAVAEGATMDVDMDKVHN